MSNHERTEGPVLLGKGPAEGGIRTPDPRITNGRGNLLQRLRVLEPSGQGNSGPVHGNRNALSLVPREALNGRAEAREISSRMDAKKARDLGGIIIRARFFAAVAYPVPISGAVLERLLEEAWTAGGAAMADAITARNCERELDALQAAAHRNGEGGAA